MDEHQIFKLCWNQNSTKLCGNSVPFKLCGNNVTTKVSENSVLTKLYGNSVPMAPLSEQYTLYNPAVPGCENEIKLKLVSSDKLFMAKLLKKLLWF